MDRSSESHRTTSSSTARSPTPCSGRVSRHWRISRATSVWRVGRSRRSPGSWERSGRPPTRSVAPFVGREPLEIALSVPPAKRYARFVRPTRQQPTQIVSYKYLLKDLLDARVTAYDTTKPKGHGILPFQRYLRDGPLSVVFETYPMPEFVPSKSRAIIRTRTEEVSWYAANYAMWRDRILENDDLGVFETTTVLEQ